MTTTDDKPYAGLKVVGAGFGRTGTSSFQKAMEICGIGACYHMFENMKHKDSKFWLRVANGETVDFNDVFGRKDQGFYYASVDNPSSMAWQQQLKQ